METPMENPMDTPKDPEAARQGHFENLGTPPSAEELLDTLQRNETLTRERIEAVLAQSISLDTAYVLAFGKMPHLHDEKSLANSGEWIIVDLGDAGRFVPVWQFETIEAGQELKMREPIRRLWNAAQKIYGYGFFNEMTAPRKSLGGRTALRAIEDGDKDAIDEVEDRIKYGSSSW
jgi:hypothetical protein